MHFPSIPGAQQRPEAGNLRCWCYQGSDVAQGKGVLKDFSQEGWDPHDKRRFEMSPVVNVPHTPRDTECTRERLQSRACKCLAGIKINKGRPENRQK